MNFIIDFVDGTSPAVIAAYFEKNGCSQLSHFDAFGHVYHVSAAKKPPLKKGVVESVVADDESAMKLMDDSVTIQDEIETKVQSTTDEDNWWKLAVMPELNLDNDTFEIIRVGKGVRVYILDSGIMADHPDFANSTIEQLWSYVDVFTDTRGHGTAIASVIGGHECGITDATMKVVKIFGDERTTLVSDIIGALNAVATDFLTQPNVPAVMNLSWAVNKNAYIEQKIVSLYDLGILPVVAAGNSNVTVDTVSPASIPQATTVGSFGPNLKPSDFSNYTGPSDVSFTASETNYGPGLDIFAPGEKIKIARLTGGFGYAAGTSIAAAVHSACVAGELARYNGNFDLVPKETFAQQISARYTAGLLTLEGVFASSPNRVSQVLIAPRSTTGKKKGGTNFVYVPKGQPFLQILFDATAYTQATLASGDFDVSLVNGNWIKGTAPGEIKSDVGVDEYSFTVTATAPDETDTFDFWVIVYDPAKYDPSDIRNIPVDQSAGVVQLFCGGCDPSFGYYCCFACDPKTAQGSNWYCPQCVCPQCTCG